MFFTKCEASVDFFFFRNQNPFGKKKKKGDPKHLTDTAENRPDERQLVLISTEESSMTWTSQDSEDKKQRAMSSI